MARIIRIISQPLRFRYYATRSSVLRNTESGLGLPTTHFDTVNVFVANLTLLNATIQRYLTQWDSSNSIQLLHITVLLDAPLTFQTSPRSPSCYMWSIPKWLPDVWLWQRVLIFLQKYMKCTASIHRMTPMQYMYVVIHVSVTNLDCNCLLMCWALFTWSSWKLSQCLELLSLCWEAVRSAWSYNVQPTVCVTVSGVPLDPGAARLDELTRDPMCLRYVWTRCTPIAR